VGFLVVLLAVGNCLYQRNTGKWGNFKVFDVAVAYTGVRIPTSISGGGEGSEFTGGPSWSLGTFAVLKFNSVSPSNDAWQEEKLEF
jgi:hypothetical protein